MVDCGRRSMTISAWASSNYQLPYYFRSALSFASSDAIWSCPYPAVGSGVSDESVFLVLCGWAWVLARQYQNKMVSYPRIDVRVQCRYTLAVFHIGPNPFEAQLLNVTGALFWFGSSFLTKPRIFDDRKSWSEAWCSDVQLSLQRISILY